MIKKIWYWIHDYLHLLHKQSLVFVYRKPPKHYLGHTIEHKAPIILIPGVYEKWHFLQALADPLSHKGHPIYVLEHLGYNTKEVHHSAFGEYDNHVWPTESCRLEGAKNIQVHSHGHHAILFNKKVRDIVMTEVEEI